MDYFLMGLAVCVIIALICWYVLYNNRRKNHKKIKDKVMVLSSTEVPVKTGERTPGSTAFVPGTAGLILASFVVRNLIKEKE